MLKYKLKSKYPALIKIDGVECEIEPCQTLEFEDCNSIDIYPIGMGKRALPFSIDTGNLCGCADYSCAKMGDEVLICLSDTARSTSFVIEKKNIGGSEFVYEIGQDAFSAQYKSWKKAFTLGERYEKYKILSKNDICYILFSGKKESALYAFNIKSGNARVFHGDITLTNDGFVTKQEKMTKEYKIDAQGLKIKSASGDFRAGLPETVPFHFLDAIKNGDYDSAYNFCSYELKGKISRANLKNFFGSVADFFSLDAATYAVITNGELKIFAFELDDDKIDEIDEKN